MSKATILIVDDEPANIGLLFELLEQRDYHPIAASDGKAALALVGVTIPDLILLDIMMPNVNGFETCARLKQQPEYAGIPVVFMTALNDTDSKLQGFSSGAVDYITKPFNHEEVYARIETQLTIARQRRELEYERESLEIRNAELDAFAHTVAHDLKNPLGGISGALELMELDYATGNQEEFKKNLQLAKKATDKANDIIEALLLLAGTSRHQDLYIEPFDMSVVVRNLDDRLAFMLKEFDTHLTAPEKWPFVVGQPAWVEEIWTNYISNALKYGGKPPRVELGYEEDGDFIRFLVRDNGPGLTAAQQAQLFVPFSRLHQERAYGHGLGLSIVQRIAAKLGGSVGVDSTPGKGSCFYFRLPKA